MIIQLLIVLVAIIVEVLYISTEKSFSFKLHYVEKPRIKIREEVFSAADYEEKGARTLGQKEFLFYHNFLPQ